MGSLTMTIDFSTFFPIEARNPVAPAPAPWNPNSVDPALMTANEYVRSVNKDGKYHPNSAYDWTLAELNKSYGGKLNEDADPSTYDTLLQRVKANGIEFTIRLKNERRSYHEWDDAKKEYRRDANGDLIPTTDKQVKERGYQPQSYTIGIFNPEGQRVATAQDEWGAQLIVVAREYRGFGLGMLIAKFATRFEPGKPSGGFSSGGENAYRQAHREAVREALVSGRYAALVRDKKMTTQRVSDIVDSADLKRRTNFNRHDFGPSPRKDWMIFADPEYGAFVLFDPKFKSLYNTGDDTAEWAEKMIYGAVNAYVLHDKYVIVNLLGAVDPKVKALMLGLAASYARQEKLPFYVDMDDIGAIDRSKYDIAEAPDMRTGFKRYPVKIRKPLDIAMMGRLSKLWLRQNDKWDELKNGILETSHAKFRLHAALAALFPVEAAIRLTLEEFMNNPTMRNENIKFQNLECYVRKGRRMLEGRVMTTLERAATKNVRRPSNMTVNPKMRPTGQYAAFGLKCEEQARLHGIDAIFVENVLNDFLPAVLLRQGYKKVPQNPEYDFGPPCFYKIVRPSVEAADKTVSIREGSIFYGEDLVGEFKINEDGRAIHVESIQLKGNWQGLGIGSAVFRLWFAFADKHNKAIILTTDAMRGRVAQQRQRKLYEGLGFVKNTGRDAYRHGKYKIREEYIRYPKGENRAKFLMSAAAKMKIDEARDLLTRWMREQFQQRRGMTVQERKDYGHSILGKITGLKAAQVSELYDWVSEFATNWKRGQ